MIITKTAKDLKPVLMAEAKSMVKIPYYLIKDARQTIFVVAAGKNEPEFNKTIGYFSKFPGMQSYHSLYGQGLILMQRNDEVGEAKEFKVVTLNPGRIVAVPAGWAAVIVNTGNGFLVVLRSDLPDEKFEDLTPVLERKGLAYYVIEKKGEISFKHNPNYLIHPQITTE